MTTIPRRAIIHIGGKRREQIPQRLLKTKETFLFDNTPPDKFYFTIDTDKEENKTILRDDQINTLLLQRRPKDLRKVKKINIQISTENQHKLIQKKLDKEQKSEILKRVKQLKQNIKKKKENSDKRKNMGLSQILIDCEMDIEYYNNIKKKFLQFEKKFFIPLNGDNDPNKYNPFRFSLNDDYKIPLELADDGNNFTEKIEKWLELNQNNTKTKYNLEKDFNQILVDMNRNPRMSFSLNNNITFGEPLFDSQYFFYTIQLAIFTSYLCYEYDKKNTEKYINKLHSWDLQDPSFYNKYVIEQYLTNGEVNETNFQKYVNDNIKNGKTRKDCCQGIYGQEMLDTIEGVLFATSNPQDKKYNIIDATALYAYIYEKNGLTKFFRSIVIGIDTKEMIKNVLKVMSIFDTVDPFLFTELFTFIEKQSDNTEESTFNKGLFWYKRRGETYIQNTSTFNDKKSPWMDSEKLKYDIFHDSSEKSLAQIIDDIKKLAKDTLNKPLEALLETHEHIDIETDITKIITVDSTKTFQKNIYCFSDGDTKLEMMYGFLRGLIFSLYGRGVHMLHFKNGNDHLHNMNSYYKYLYKYGINGWILFTAIHLKNIRTAISFNEKTIESLSFNKQKKQDRLGGEFIDFFTKDRKEENLPDGTPNLSIRETDFFLHATSLMGDDSSIYYSRKKVTGKQFNFLHNVFINPLTSNIKETYDKHFDFFIEHIENQHGSMKKFETKFNELYNSSLILYKNGYMKDERLNKIKKMHKGITIVDKISDIWDKHKNDPRISFHKSKNHPEEALKKMSKGWLGDIKHDYLRNALDGVYHVCYNTFMKDVSKIIKPVFNIKYKEGKCPNVASLWPRHSGRPFIFVNKLFGFYGQYVDLDEPYISFNTEKEIKKKLLKRNSCLPNYWFNTKNMFTEKEIEKNKLLYDINHPSFKKRPIDWKEVENVLNPGGLFLKHPPIPSGIERGDSTSSDDSYDSIEEKFDAPIVERKDSDEPIIGSEPEDLSEEMREHADQEELQRRQEMAELAEQQYRKQEELKAQIDAQLKKAEEFANRLAIPIKQDDDDINLSDLDQKDDSGDEEEDTGPTKLPESHASKILRYKRILARNYEAEIVPVPDSGDCLFEALSNHLKGTTDEISHQELRQNIVNHIMASWVNYVDDILIEVDGRRRYETPADYEKQMRATAADPDHPQGRFGGQAEIKAFMDMYPQYKIQILKYENKEMHEFNFSLPDLKNPKVITLFLFDVHYQNLKKIDTPESSGSVVKPKGSQLVSQPRKETVEEKQLRNEIQTYIRKIDKLIEKVEKHKQEAMQCKRKGNNDEAILCLKRLKTTEKHIELLKKRLKQVRIKLKKSQQHQQGGSNNIYINKCKNHRHNKTKKFRMKLKDIDNWVYLEPRKKKKFTRKKY